MSFEDSDPILRRYLQEISQYPLISAKQEVELAALIKQGDKKATAVLIRANLRLVVKIARDYANFGLPLLDLISEGNIGLMKAATRFDPVKGGKLSTYAAWWIKQSIKRALANQSKTIRLPVHLVDKIAKIRRVGDGMSEMLGREATDEEIAEEIGISSVKVSQLKLAASRPSSLDAPVSDENSMEYSEILRDASAYNPFEELREKDTSVELEDVLGKLDARERSIIGSRFGLNGEEPITLEEVGAKLGVTRERIRQLQNLALKKMKRALQGKDAIGYPSSIAVMA
ncbi:MAG: RNA polymerase sigma factor RpoD/SigA [Chthoniobacterales bacterium]